MREECLPLFFERNNFFFDMDERSVMSYLGPFAQTPGFGKLRSITVATGEWRRPYNGEIIPAMEFQIDLRALEMGAYGWRGVKYRGQYDYLKPKLERMMEKERDVPGGSGLSFLRKILTTVRESSVSLKRTEKSVMLPVSQAMAASRVISPKG